MNASEAPSAGTRRQATPAADRQAPAAAPAELARRVAAALSPNRSDALAAVLAAAAPAPASYEASVRGGRSGQLTAGRMMIEQASPEVLSAIAVALAVPLPAVATRWLELAARERLPLIVGWDLRGGRAERCVKLYVNASDAAEERRAHLTATLVPDVAFGGTPPAVLGMNLRADAVIETKLYAQAADAVALAGAAGARAAALAAAARSEGADAGGVLSSDVVDGALQPRAFFVALREPSSGTAWHCVRALPGYDDEAIAALLPFPAAPPRSIGVSLGDDSWTLYCKPRDSGRAPEALEPTAVFRSGDVEVGIFVEPSQQAARAFRRTAQHAVSVRVRAGDPPPLALEALVDWFTDRVAAAERGGTPTDAIGEPPPPWRAIDPPPRGARGRSA